MGKRVYQDQLLERLDPRGMPYYWFGGPPPSGVAEPGTDFHAVYSGRVAITPIQLDLTARRLLERIRGWDWQLADEDGPDPGGQRHPMTGTWHEGGRWRRPADGVVTGSAGGLAE